MLLMISRAEPYCMFGFLRLPARSGLSPRPSPPKGQQPVAIMCRGAAVLATPTFTILPSGFNSFQIGEPTYRGKETVITKTIIEGTLHRLGQSWLSLLDDPDAQVQRWGKHCFARGPFPDGLDRLEPGTTAWILAKEDASWTYAAREPG